MLTGAYVGGDSVLHRLRPGTKLVLLAMVLLPLGVLTARADLVGLAAVGAGALVVGAAMAHARIPLRALGRELAPLRWFLLVLVPYEWWAFGLVPMASSLGCIVVGIALASLLTLTTRIADLLDSLDAGLRRALRPARRLGVDADRVAAAVALSIALVLRSVPVLRRLAAQAREAREARGLGRSPAVLITPVVVLAVRHGQAVGDALAARGLDDPTDPTTDPADDPTTDPSDRAPS